MNIDWERYFKTSLGLKRREINKLMKIENQKQRLDAAFMVWYKNKPIKAK